MKPFSTTVFATTLTSLLLSPFAAAEEVNTTLSWSSNSNVVIDVPRGDIEVLGTDSTSVTVSGRIDSEAEAFIFEQQGDVLRIQVKLPRNWGNQQNNAKQFSDLKISLPSQAQVDIDVVSTDIDISKVNSIEIESVSGDVRASVSSDSVEIDAVSGDVTVREANGSIDIETVSGDINADDSRGEFELSSVSGDIRGKNLNGELELESVSGDIEIDILELTALEGRSVSGDIGINGKTLALKSELELETVSGDVTLSIADIGSVSVHAHTGGGGDIDNDWSEDNVQKSKYGGNKSLEFGSGAKTVTLNTVSGLLALKRR
ncbi:DUF4097 family beta strand repeat-containing protein [Ferrimonas lipolytica]|uniref:DUF4097 domain-containing protein n=1 Tax=Ferrimonas lipolytica TaxID=2724191 RepID=A0A6H1UIA3_9GAMM|nr:DUF4097 family beta strand repeat-containing protein [Ferrimonas lipolytica]QIZ77522.1 DUF4097 domain-containing protein [Ferrimonas lipolytica]